MDPITTSIILGVLANGLYDIAIKGAQRVSPSSKLSQRLRELQWERLFEDGNLQTQIEQYTTYGKSQEKLIEIGKALQQAIEKDAGLAAGLQKLLASEEDLRELIKLTAEESTHHTQLPPAKRLELATKLNGLPPEQLNIIIFALNPPKGIIPDTSATQGNRTFALLNWAEGTGGCGLSEVQQVLEGLLTS